MEDYIAKKDFKNQVFISVIAWLVIVITSLVIFLITWGLVDNLLKWYNLIPTHYMEFPVEGYFVKQLFLLFTSLIVLTVSIGLQKRKKWGKFLFGVFLITLIFGSIFLMALRGKRYIIDGRESVITFIFSEILGIILITLFIKIFITLNSKAFKTYFK